MKKIKYFIQFIIIIFLFILFKILGLKFQQRGSIFKLIGPLFRSNRISHDNLNLAFPEMNENKRNEILNKMCLTLCNFCRIYFH